MSPSQQRMHLEAHSEPQLTGPTRLWNSRMQATVLWDFTRAKPGAEPARSTVSRHPERKTCCQPDHSLTNPTTCRYDIHPWQCCGVRRLGAAWQPRLELECPPSLFQKVGGVHCSNCFTTRRRGDLRASVPRIQGAASCGIHSRPRKRFVCTGCHRNMEILVRRPQPRPQQRKCARLWHGPANPRHQAEYQVGRRAGVLSSCRAPAKPPHPEGNSQKDHMGQREEQERGPSGKRSRGAYR